MSQVTAFLSYTHTDDEFFGGYITAFRKVLENAVHVVTGEKRFRIFQDIDGIVVGENWQKKLSAAIEESSFLIPMLTPLYFNSEPCRSELTEFLGHERGLNREDLILPVYFFTTPKLQKDDERAKDALATELSKRQMFDWRERADLPLNDPAARHAMVDLAMQIGTRLPLVARPDSMPDAARRPARDAGAASNLADAGPGAGAEQHARREALPSQTILWIDDHPDNNKWEQRALASYGYEFVLASSTDEAKRILGDGGVLTAMISDMGRPGDSKAGVSLLNEVRGRNISTPYFVYTTRNNAKAYAAELRSKGGDGITGDPDDLVQMVVSATRGNSTSRSHPRS